MDLLYNHADIDLRCRAASSWSVPAHGSLLTGKLPHKHGVHADCFDYTTIEDSFLKRLDHHTIGVSANSYASSTFGFDSHFDRFIDARPNRYFSDALDVNDWLSSDTDLWREVLGDDQPIRSIANVGYLGLKHLTQRLPMPALIDEGMKRQIRILKKQSSDEPFVMFANIMEAHRPMFQHIGLDRKYAPYRWTSRSVGKWEINTSEDPNTEYQSYLETYRDLYNGSLKYMDRYLDSFISGLSDLTDKETTVIVTADHGEGLAFPEDDGLIDHTGIFTDSVLDVPFLIFNPPEEFNPDFVSHLDIPEIVTRMAHGNTPNIDRDWAPSETIGAMGTPDRNKSWWDRTSRSLWKPGEKYTWNSESDTSPPEAADTYFDTPIELCGKETEHNFDQSTQAQLESLGYL
jgi:arylsulfatase A-like enzyme